MKSNEEPYLTRELLISLDIISKNKKIINKRLKQAENDLLSKSYPESDRVRHTESRKRLELSFYNYCQFLARKYVLEYDLNYKLSDDVLAFCAGLSRETFVERISNRKLYELDDEKTKNRLVELGFLNFIIQKNIDIEELSKVYKQNKKKSDLSIKYTTEYAYIVNIIRHEYTNYDKILRSANIEKGSYDYYLVKRQTLLMIAVNYIYLAEECFSQIYSTGQIYYKNNNGEFISREFQKNITK